MYAFKQYAFNMSYILKAGQGVFAIYYLMKFKYQLPLAPIKEVTFKFLLKVIPLFLSPYFTSNNWVAKHTAGLYQGILKFQKYV